MRVGCLMLVEHEQEREKDREWDYPSRGFGFVNDIALACQLVYGLFMLSVV